MTPWPHQVRLIQRIKAAIASGQKRICAVIATGGGKTWCQMEMARESVFRRDPAILYTNRRLLIEQTIQSLEEFGLEYGVRAAGYPMESHKLFQISSIQTETTRVLRKKRWSLFDAKLVLIDEGHLYTDSPEAKKILDAHVEAGAAYVLFTATPLGMGSVAETLIVEGTQSQLRDCGANIPAIHYAPSEPDMRSFRKIKAEAALAPKDVENAMAPKLVWGSVLESFNKLNPTRRPTILFAPGVGESLWYAQKFTEYGIRAAHIDGEDVWCDGEFRRTAPDVRADIIRRSKDRDIVVLCNRFVLREGINAPWISHGVFATIFGSVQTYLQSGGRLLRAFPGDEVVTIQDHGGNWWRYGSLNEDRRWELYHTSDIVRRQRSKRIREGQEKEPFLCPKCQKVWVAGILCDPIFGGCGYSLAKIKRARPVITAKGELREATGVIFRPRSTYAKPDGPARWQKMYWRSRSSGRGRKTFAQAEVVFARENYWQWPDPSWPLMPKNENQWSWYVEQVPLSDLTSLPENFKCQSTARLDLPDAPATQTNGQSGSTPSAKSTGSQSSSETAAPDSRPAGAPDAGIASASTSTANGQAWTSPTAPSTDGPASTPSSKSSTQSGGISQLNARCNSCKAEMIWAKNIDSDKSIPLDPIPSDKGNVRLFPDGTCEVLTQLEMAAAKEGGEQLLISHFATCPDAKRFRKGKVGNDAGRVPK